MPLLKSFPTANAKNAQNRKFVQYHDFQQVVISLHFSQIVKAMLSPSQSIALAVQKHAY